MIQVGKFRVALPDEEYVWEPDEVSVGEALMIEGEFGGTYLEWLRAIDKEKADAVQILVWFLRRKAGQQMDRHGVDFQIRKFRLVELSEDGDDPEAPAGSEPASQSTSQPSSTSPRTSSTGSPSLTSVG